MSLRVEGWVRTSTLSVPMTSVAFRRGSDTTPSGTSGGLNAAVSRLRLADEEPVGPVPLNDRNDRGTVRGGLTATIGEYDRDHLRTACGVVSRLQRQRRRTTGGEKKGGYAQPNSTMGCPPTLTRRAAGTSEPSAATCDRSVVFSHRGREPSGFPGSCSGSRCARARGPSSSTITSHPFRGKPCS
jgi:hypothetical protein